MINLFVKVVRGVLSGLKSIWPYLSSTLMKAVLGLSGIYGWIASFVIKKAGDVVIQEGEIAIDKVANSEAERIIQELDGKKLTPKESKMLDDAEKEILEGK